jgi:peptidoglycan hydrolase-like protein with peptidoglycan-binding domain
MTASALTQLPLIAGGALLSGSSRAALWAVARYMRAPLANTALLALATMTAMAGSNALYNQTVPHPSPFFTASPMVPRPVDVPADVQAVPSLETSSVAPVERSAAETVSAPAETTGSLPPPVVPSEPVGNADVFAVQKKLLEMGLFEGQVDGYYGPKTAGAIRAFEERNGMTPEGALTPTVVQRILGGDVGAVTQAIPQPIAAPEPVVATAEPAAVAPAARAVVAPPAETVAAVAETRPDILIGRVEEPTTIERAIASATTTIDSLVASLDTTRRAPAALPNAPVPQAAVGAAPAPQQQASLPPVPPATVSQQPMPPVIQQASSVSAAGPAEPVAVAPVVVASTESTSTPPASNETLVTQVQRGLASLGFLHGAIDGRPGESTARAIRNFEVYHNYKVTGEITPTLVDMLVTAGASI